MKSAQVLIILASKSDTETIRRCGELLDKFGVAYLQEISSAHRNPGRTVEIVKKAEIEGVKVIVAAAGMAAALPGFVASQTILPVIGVPLANSALNGMDALLSVVQMPAGVPVAAVAIGSQGAQNAALLAIEILALSDGSLREKLLAYRKELGGA
jgi:5-(carboxyamino)imidazole ribonucleotide mutase